MIEYVSVALLCTVLGGVLGILTFSRNKSFGYIKSGIIDGRNE